MMCPSTIDENGMAKPNYSYEKRQRELAKKQKKAEKEKRKSAPPAPAQDQAGEQQPDSSTPASTGS